MQHHVKLKNDSESDEIKDKVADEGSQIFLEPYVETSDGAHVDETRLTVHLLGTSAVSAWWLGIGSKIMIDSGDDAISWKYGQ